MREYKRPNKAIMAVALAFAFVLLLVIGVFLFGKPAATHVEITLPSGQERPDVTTDDQYLAENTLLRVTPENAAVALQALKHPMYYHQVYTVSVGRGSSLAETTVELWVNDDQIRAQVTRGDETKIILSNGKRVCFWYASDERPIYLTLDEGVTFEDILGLPAFDYLQTLSAGNVTDAEYLMLEDDAVEVPCIFLSLMETNGAQTRYWINLQTGLLYQADSVENNLQAYRVREASFDRLVSGDEIFADKFNRPDGAAAFTG